MKLDPGSGDPTQEGGAPYTKVSDGTVYIVDGSSGQATFGTMDHPAHYKSILQLGSVILEVDGNTLSGQFLRSTGVIEDNFVIVKQAEPEGQTRPRISYASTVNGRITLNWSARIGARYVVQRTLSLQSPSWENVGDPVTATATIESWSTQVEGGPPASFYRVVEIE